MKTYRVIAALLALVMLLGMFAGCSKNRGETTDPANPSNNPGTKTETNDEKAASTSKYAYQAEYLPIPDNIQYVNTSTSPVQSSTARRPTPTKTARKSSTTTTARRCSRWTLRPATARS